MPTRPLPRIARPLNGTADFDIRKEFGLYLLDPLQQAREAEYYLKQAYRLNPTDEAVNAGLARLGVAMTPTPTPAAHQPPANPPVTEVARRAARPGA